LFQAVQAGNPVCPLLGSGQRGQEHGRQNGDDGNHHQKLDEGKSFLGPPIRRNDSC
jgi:hypothetical protein